MGKITSSLIAMLFVLGCSSSPGPAGDSEPPPPDGIDDMESGPEFKETSTSPKAPPSGPVQTKMTSTPYTDSSALAEAIRSGNDTSIARVAFQVLAKNPNDYKALNALGYHYYKKGQYPAALLMINKALKANPNGSDAHNNLGLVLLAQKEQKEAIQAFRKALEVNPRDGFAAANLGAIYIANKDYPKAAVAMEIAYRQNSKDERILNNYGIALAATGKYSQAQEMYKQAMGANSSNKDVLLNYAILLIEHLKKPQEGLDLLSKVRFLGPSTEARKRINLLENKAKAGLQ